MTEIFNSEEPCWLLRQYKKKIPKRISKRFTGKPVHSLTTLQLRNEFGATAPDPSIDYTIDARTDKGKLDRSKGCMDFMPRKVERENANAAFVGNHPCFIALVDVVGYGPVFMGRAKIAILGIHVWEKFSFAFGRHENDYEGIFEL